MAEYICKNGILRPINHIYQCVDKLVEGVDYEFVNGLSLRNYNLVTIDSQFPIEFKIKPVSGFQNILLNGGSTSYMFIQNSNNNIFQYRNGGNSYAQLMVNVFGKQWVWKFNENNYTIGGVSKAYYSGFDKNKTFVFNTTRSDAQTNAHIVFYYIKSATIDLRPIRLLRDVSGKHTSNKQPKSAESLGLLDVNSQILYFGSGSSIEVYND